MTSTGQLNVIPPIRGSAGLGIDGEKDSNHADAGTVGTDPDFSGLL